MASLKNTQLNTQMLKYANYGLVTGDSLGMDKGVKLLTSWVQRSGEGIRVKHALQLPCKCKEVKVTCKEQRNDNANESQWPKSQKTVFAIPNIPKRMDNENKSQKKASAIRNTKPKGKTS